MKKAQGIKPHDVLPGLQVIRDIYNLPRIPVDSEGGCRCYYCEKHLKRSQRKKFFKLPKYVLIPFFLQSTGLLPQRRCYRLSSVLDKYKVKVGKRQTNEAKLVGHDQLLEHCSANAEAMGSNPVGGLIFFFQFAIS